MKRRSFLAAPIVAALPASKAVTAISGTVTGRWSSSVPAIQELTRSQVKSAMFARNYGMKAPFFVSGPADHINYRRTLHEADLSSIEARVMGNMEAGRDPYTVG
jgi:hypothetical protein